MDDFGSPGLAVLGGGVAGLAAGHFARTAGRPFTVLEAESEPGGMCRTLKFGDFRIDTGAHRFHARIPSATALVRGLLGDRLTVVDVPSEICEGGRFVRFPLEPLNLLKARGPAFFAAAAVDLLRSRLGEGADADGNFEGFALARYGRRIARPYLLDYSEKLWGVPPRTLLPEAAGNRLQGLKLSRMFASLSPAAPGRSSHLEGSFLYPRGGIEAIPLALAESCGSGRVRCQCRVTRIFHDGRAVREVEINGRQRLGVRAAVTTLPLTEFLSLLAPPPPEAVSRAAAALAFRSLVLTILLLDHPDVTRAATIYFPERKYPFTRVAEPKRRDPGMSPPGKTSLVAEFPCDPGDAVWIAEDASLVERALDPLVALGWVRRERVLKAHVRRFRFAYPLLTVGVAESLAVVVEYVSSFRNLASAGRCARFRYSHIHDQIDEGRKAVEALRTRGEI